MSHRIVTSIAFAVLLVLPARAQQERPRPYPVFHPPQFEEAIEAGTRTPDGRPGPAYWQNTTRYDIDVALSPATNMVRGRETINYTNHSPDTLAQLVVHLRQNIYAPGSRRNTALQVTGGLHLAEATVEGTPLIERATTREVGYTIENTIMRIHPPEPVLPGQTVELSFAWSYELRSRGKAPRQGTDGEVYYVAYWYPQMSVYDDVQGWDIDPFVQWAEFYMGFADYDVRVTAPDDFLVAATGELQNAEEVLASFVRERLQEAERTRETVQVVAKNERGEATLPAEDNQHSWHFRAEEVRDFAFGASDRWVWDATSASTGEGTAAAHAFYRPGTRSWERAAEFVQLSVEYLSEEVLPYPYPHMTSVEGIVGGGMEYPMITIIGGDRSPERLFGVHLHEIAHVWFPMIVGSQETDFTWMDEGLATFFTKEARRLYFETGVEELWHPPSGYFSRAGTAGEDPPMTHGDRFQSVGALVTASYDKTSRLYRALQGLYGEAAVAGALQDYAEAWRFKHPYPYDLFNRFEAALGEELDWFWRSLLYETWTMDHALAGVEQTDEGVRVTVADEGLVPMPALVEVSYRDGRTETRRLPVEPWLEGARRQTATFPPGEVTRVALDPEHYLPDVDRSDNVWGAEETQ